MTPTGHRRLSKALVISWFALVSIALILVVLIAVIPNELNAHMPIWSIGIPFVLLVAVFCLPLLAVAMFLDRRYQRKEP